MADKTPRTIPVGNAAGTEWSGSAPIIRPEPWMRDAACRQVDPEIFFPGTGGRERADMARAVCATCDVIDDCLDFAQRTTQTHGIWAGKSGNELSRLRNGRAA